MQNGNLTEADRSEIGKVWDYSKYTRESVEGQLIGSSIIAVYPLFGMDSKGRVYDAGLSIVYQAQGSSEIKTLDITTQNCCSRDDETTLSVEIGYVSPEPIYLLEGIK